MDGFKPMVKMKCGGSVSKAVEKAKMCGGGKMKEGGDVDLKQDKALIKKAISQHDKQEHPGEKTELKLKQGGRSKKEKGSVKKFKAGGAIEMKKDSGDKDTIKKIKATGAKKADAPSKASVKSKDAAAKSSGDKDAIKKVKPALKKAAAPSKTSGVDAFADGGMAGYGRGGATGAEGPIPPSIAAQLMEAAQGARLRGGNPSPMGSNALPVDNPVISAGPLPAQGTGSPMGGMPANAYQRFQQQNPGAKPGMDPRAIQQLLQSPAFQRSNRNFTDQ